MISDFRIIENPDLPENTFMLVGQKHEDLRTIEAVAFHNGQVLGPVEYEVGPCQYEDGKFKIPVKLINA